ncbi:MAG: hypothetical protein AAF959_10940 [Cyanobacteria bacterium P01_D01_bin.56]
MKLPELKRRTYTYWQELLAANDVVPDLAQFKPEVRTIGDMRYKRTWQRALARFMALVYIDTCLEAWQLIVHELNFTKARWDYDLRFLILEEMVQHPDGLALLQAGLNQLYAPDIQHDAAHHEQRLSLLVGQQPQQGACRHTIGLAG